MKKQFIILLIVCSVLAVINFAIFVLFGLSPVGFWRKLGFFFLVYVQSAIPYMLLFWLWKNMELAKSMGVPMTPPKTPGNASPDL